MIPPNTRIWIAAGATDMRCGFNSLLQERVSEVFETGKSTTGEPPVDVTVLHAKIGQLALENDFLSGALSKAGLLSGKR